MNSRFAIRYAGIIIVPCLLFVESPLAMVNAADPIEQGRQSLRSVGTVPWYDPGNDSIRSVTGEDMPTSVRRRSPDRDSSPQDERSSRSSFTWSSRGSSLLGNILVGLGWSVLAILLLGTLLLIIRQIFSYQSRRSRKSQQNLPKDLPDSSEMEQLPVATEMSPSNLLKEAQRCYDEGRYADATRYLFCYQLIELHRRGRIHLTRGKTNRQYLGEIRSNRELYSLVEETMVAFEEVFFGRFPIDRRRFEQCWSRLDEFEGLTIQES